MWRGSERLALAEQVPGLVEGHLDLGETLPRRVVGVARGLALPQLVLLS